MSKLENPVLMATIGAAQGLRGEVRVKSFTDDPTALGEYGNLHSADGRVFEVLEIREAKNVVIVRFRGVNDRNAAEALNGLDLFIERDNLPDDDLDEDEFFYADLEGLEAIDGNGTSYGKVSGVFDFGAGDLLELEGARPASGADPVYRMVGAGDRSGSGAAAGRSGCGRPYRRQGPGSG